VGRALGIGVRVASKMVSQRIERATTPGPAPLADAMPSRPVDTVTANGVPAGRVRADAGPVRSVLTGERVATAKRGARAFGQALLGPFTHAGGILWLEITGLFFAFFALFFVQSVYRVHTAWRQGPEHGHLLLYSVLAVAFGWFSVSSFIRAYRKSHRGPRAGNGAR
jgi:hypothetical protein